MMNRIDSKLKECKEKNEKAMITYIMAGVPDMERTIDVIKAQAKAGVDVVEIGVPFSDPVADGTVIQNAGYQSIQNGTNLQKVFLAVNQLRKECEIPVVLMLYYNTIMHYGIGKFVTMCQETGVDGFIIPDLPREEQFEIREYLNGEDAPYLIPLVSPVSKDRIPYLLEDAKGFVYCVSSMGVTGQSADFHKDVNAYLNSVKKVSSVPVMMGFGIRCAQDVKEQLPYADGFVIGSAFIELMESCGYNDEKAEEFVRKFKSEVKN